jgi:hypothetical protein
MTPSSARYPISTPAPSSPAAALRPAALSAAGLTSAGRISTARSSNALSSDALPSNALSSAARSSNALSSAALSSTDPSGRDAGTLPRRLAGGQFGTATAPITSWRDSTTRSVGRPEFDIWIDRETWTATIDGQHLELTFLEFELLDFLTRHPGVVHSRTRLLESVWGYDLAGQTVAAGRTVDVHVTRLRRKLGLGYRDRIETIRRVGYRYRPM